MLNHGNRLKAASGICLLLLSVILYIPGCGSDSTTPTSNTSADTSVVVYDSIDIPVARALNLYDGVYSALNDPKTDLTIQSLIPNNYYFQNGAVTGTSSTKLSIVDTSGTTKSAFISLASVSAWGSSGADIQESIFTLSTTPNLPAGLTKLPTFGFYLQGKFTNGSTYSKVYGIMHVNSISSGANSVINVSVKYNKAGKNKFTK